MAPRDLQRSTKRKRLAKRDAETVVTTIALTRRKHLLLSARAKALNWTFTALVRAALDEWLTRHPARGAR